LTHRNNGAAIDLSKQKKFIGENCNTFLADYCFDFIRKKKLSPDKVTLNLTRPRNQNPHHPFLFVFASLSLL
jgi:hypothetical protein